MKIYLIFQDDNQRLFDLIKTLHLQHDENSSMALVVKSDSLELFDRSNSENSFLKVDFTSKQNNYRCFNFIKKNEALSKAIGIKKMYFPSVLDATAGLGNDSFILSFLGCYVLMIERNPIVIALLYDGLYRGYKDKKIGNWLRKRLHLVFNNSLNMLNMNILKPDVIYLDPMYPIRKKKLYQKKICNFLEN